MKPAPPVTSAFTISPPSTRVQKPFRPLPDEFALPAGPAPPRHGQRHLRKHKIEGDVKQFGAASQIRERKTDGGEQVESSLRDKERPIDTARSRKHFRRNEGYKHGRRDSHAQNVV